MQERVSYRVIGPSFEGFFSRRAVLAAVTRLDVNPRLQPHRALIV